LLRGQDVFHVADSPLRLLRRGDEAVELLGDRTGVAHGKTLVAQELKHFEHGLRLGIDELAVLQRLLVALQALPEHGPGLGLDLLDALGPLRDLAVEHGDPLLDPLRVGGGEVGLVAHHRVAHAQVEGEEELQLLDQLLQEHARRGVQAPVVLPDLPGQGLETAVALALRIRQDPQHFRDLSLLLDLLLLPVLFHLLGFDQALEAGAPGHNREDGELHARDQDQGEGASGDEGEANRGG
jgi:hypothetical protein